MDIPARIEVSGNGFGIRSHYDQRAEMVPDQVRVFALKNIVNQFY